MLARRGWYGGLLPLAQTVTHGGAEPMVPGHLDGAADRECTVCLPSCCREMGLVPLRDCQAQLSRYEANEFRTPNPNPPLSIPVVTCYTSNPSVQESCPDDVRRGIRGRRGRCCKRGYALAKKNIQHLLRVGRISGNFAYAAADDAPDTSSFGIIDWDRFGPVLGALPDAVQPEKLWQASSRR